MWKKRKFSVPLHPITTAVILSNYTKKHSSSNVLNARPKYKRLNTEENAIVSVDVNC